MSTSDPELHAASGATVAAYPRSDAEEATAEAARLPAYRRPLGLAVIAVALLVCIWLSFAFGAKPVPLSQVWHGLLDHDSSDASVIVWRLRLPRTVAAIVTGSAFAVSGALIQALTRNPLADPGILGVNAGAGFAVTLGVGLLGITSTQQYVWFAFIGAALATVGVYVIGTAGRRTVSPVTLVLAGTALGAVLGAYSSFLELMSPRTFQALRTWGLGSAAGTDLSDTLDLLPFLVVGLVLALALSGPLNAIALGDDLARSLGARIMLTRVLGIVAVTLLAGGSTALTGGIAFVGLMVPHVVRWFTGPDQRWIIAYSTLAGPVLVVLADVIGRVLVIPSELEAGLVTSFVGAPVLILLVRSRKASAL